MSTASEQPGPGLPEENAEPAEAAESVEAMDAVGAVESKESVDAMNAMDAMDAMNAIDAAPAVPAADPAESIGSAAAPAELPAPAPEEVAVAASAGDLPPADLPEEDPREETEDERVARERVEFDKLVASFHSESAPDPQPNRPGGAGTRKIIRYPVLEPRPEWHAEIVEPTDETTIDPLDHVEHYEQPDPELPRIASATLAAATLLAVSVGFLVLHTLLGLNTPDYFSWLAVIGVCGGVFSLVSRMKPDRDEYDDPGNGAVV